MKRKIVLVALAITFTAQTTFPVAQAAMIQATPVTHTRGAEPEVVISNKPLTDQEILDATANMKKQGIDALKTLSTSNLSDIIKNPAARKVVAKLRISMTKQAKARGIKTASSFHPPKNSILMSFDDAILFLKFQYLLVSMDLYGMNKSDNEFVFQTECALATLQEAINGHLWVRRKSYTSYDNPIFLRSSSLAVFFSPWTEVGFFVQTSNSPSSGHSGYFKSLSKAIDNELMAHGKKKQRNEVIPASIVKMAQGIVYDASWQKDLKTSDEIEFGRKLHWARVYNLMLELDYEIASINADNRSKDLYSQLLSEIQTMVYGG